VIVVTASRSRRVYCSSLAYETQRTELVPLRRPSSSLWSDSMTMTTTEFFAYLKSFRNLEPSYHIIEYDGSDTFPDGRHASAGVTVRKGTQLLQVEGFATIRLPLCSTSMITITTYRRDQQDIVPPEVARGIDNDVVCCLFGDLYLRKYGKEALLVERGQTTRAPSKSTRRVSRTTYQSATLDRACRAVEVYNHGLDGRGVPKADLDIRAHKMFANGLGSTKADIEQQLRFIGGDYGGVAGFPSAITLAPVITKDIFDIREEYERTAASAHGILSQVADRSTIEFLFHPFVQVLGNKSNWLVWAVKFWHHLNRDAFPIESSEVDAFFRVTSYRSQVDRYMTLLNRFRTFVLSHRDWLPHLRQADGGVDGEVDGKLCAPRTSCGTKCATVSPNWTTPNCEDNTP
jgi:hypothetical protein